jgi:hypothetical protein
VTKSVRRFAQSKAALDCEDIEGLLAMGCPADEYDSEAAMIDNRIAELEWNKEAGPARPQVEQIVAEVWNEMFGPFSDEDLQKRQSAFASVALKIMGA